MPQHIGLLYCNPQRSWEEHRCQTQVKRARRKENNPAQNTNSKVCKEQEARRHVYENIELLQLLEHYELARRLKRAKP